MPSAPRRPPAASDPSDGRPHRSGGPSTAEEAKRVLAEGEALARLTKMLEELRDIFASHPRLVEFFEADVVQLKAELCEPAGDDDETEGDDEDDEADESEGDDADGSSLSNPDRLAAFLLKRDNAPATLSEFFKATNIPKSSIKNILYVKAARTRFVKVETGKFHQWRLADADAEAERLQTDADE